MFRILAITAALLGLASIAQADVYRWTDAKGVVQYSDKWVPGSVVVKTDKNHVSAPVPGEAAPSDSAAETDALPPPSAAAAQRDKRTVEADVAKSKAAQCKDAREKYDKAIASRRIYSQGPNGEKTFVSDAEADAYRMQLLNARKQFCGS